MSEVAAPYSSRLRARVSLKFCGLDWLGVSSARLLLFTLVPAICVANPIELPGTRKWEVSVSQTISSFSVAVRLGLMA